MLAVGTVVQVVSDPFAGRTGTVIGHQAHPENGMIGNVTDIDVSEVFGPGQLLVGLDSVFRVVAGPSRKTEPKVFDA